MDYFVSPDAVILSQVMPEDKPSEITSLQVQADIAKMYQVVYGNQLDEAGPIMVGVAAPQLGIARRIILVDVAAEGHGKVGNLKTYINPVIEWSSDDEAEWYEGCYSTARVCGVVSRPNHVRVRAMNEIGEAIHEEHSGYVARIFQHEIDHLNGKVFVDRILDESKLHWVEIDRMPAYRNNEGWRSWEHICSRDRWMRIKGLSA